MNLNEHINRIKTLMSINENTIPVNLTPQYLKERIPFLKSFNDFSDENRINMQKITYNQNVNMKLGNHILEFKQFNTSSEFYYSIYEMDSERYRITFSLQNRFWAMPPNYKSGHNELEYRTLLMALQQMEKKLSYTYDEIKPEPTLSPEELNQVINNLNKCFFEFEDYVINQMSVDLQNPLDETIEYNGKLSNDDYNWLERTGRKSYSGGELTPIILNNKLVGGLHISKMSGVWGIDYIEIKPEYRNQGILRKIIYDQAENGVVHFISANPDLQQKLSTYGDVNTDPDTDITTLTLK